MHIYDMCIHDAHCRTVFPQNKTPNPSHSLAILFTVWLCKLYTAEFGHIESNKQPFPTVMFFSEQHFGSFFCKHGECECVLLTLPFLFAKSADRGECHLRGG